MWKERSGLSIFTRYCLMFSNFGTGTWFLLRHLSSMFSKETLRMEANDGLPQARVTTGPRDFPGHYVHRGASKSSPPTSQISGSLPRDLSEKKVRF
jgi:hypothetical protein